MCSTTHLAENQEVKHFSAPVPPAQAFGLPKQRHQLENKGSAAPQTATPAGTQLTVTIQ